MGSDMDWLKAGLYQQQCPETQTFTSSESNVERGNCGEDGVTYVKVAEILSIHYTQK